MTPSPTPTPAPFGRSSGERVLIRVLRLGLLLAAAIAVVGAIVGGILAGPNGVWSALIGTAMTLVFLGITAVSVLAAGRAGMTAFFAIVLGAWLVKAVLFIVAVLLLRDAPFVNGVVLFVTVVVSVLGTLVVDVVAVVRGRVPYVSDPRPVDGEPPRAPGA